MKTAYILALTVMVSSAPAFAREGFGGRDRSVASAKTSAPEIVKWIGEISDSSSEHTTTHGHSLEFVNKETGNSYDIVDSPELVKLHHESEKNYLVEIEAEKTPRFLFWGNNLIVKNFKVLDETASVPHLPAPEPSQIKVRGGRDR